MHAFTVIVAQADCIVAEHLAANLHTFFKDIVVARDVDEVRHHIQRDFADVVVVDLDLAEPGELRTLVDEFRHVGVLCTHRAPDDEMWKQCLEIGALDCCACSDLAGIVRAARKHSQSRMAKAA